MQKVHACLFVAIIVIFSLVCSTHEEIRPKPYAGIDYVASITEYPQLLSMYSPGFGSGFFVNNEHNPYLITNRHVITGGEPVSRRKISVMGEDNVYQNVHGEVVCLFAKIDIALVQIESLPKGSKICQFEHQPTKVGDDIYYFGQPARRGRFFLYCGKFSAINLKYKPNEFTDAINIQAIGGNSGSPILNNRNKCIGVLTSTIPEGNQTFIVPFREIKKEFEKVKLGDILKGTFEEDLVKRNQGKVQFY